MKPWIPDKEGRVVDVKYFERNDGVFVRHITRECLYTREQLEHLANFKMEEAQRIRERAARKRDELIASDMEKNANQMKELLSK